MTNISIIRVESQKDLKAFIELPAKIHQNNAKWVPPLYNDEWEFFDREKNENFLKNDCVLWLAIEENKPVGRIMGIIPKVYNKKYNANDARFFALECIDNLSVFEALINEVIAWAKSNQKNRLIGPYGFSDKDPQGFQIEGFEHLPVIATATNAAYLPSFVTQLGFEKLLDCVVYNLPIPKALPERQKAILERIVKNTKLRLLPIGSKWALRPYILPVLRLVNETYAELYGFEEMNDKEMRKFANQYLPILDPDFVKILVDEENNPIAFGIAMPDMSVGIQKANGKLFPFGFIKILLSAKKTKQLDLLLGAVKPSYRGRGLTMILAKELFATAQKRKLEYIDSHLILETNHLMRAEFVKMGGVIYKRYRVFHKKL